MDQRVCGIMFKGRELRFIATRRSTSLFVPLEDLSAALSVAMSGADSKSWNNVLKRRLANGVDPTAKQRVYLDGRIMPTVSSGFVLMLCHSLGRLIQCDPSLAPAATGFAEFRRLIFKSLATARRRFDSAEPALDRHPGPRAS